MLYLFNRNIQPNPTIISAGTTINGDAGSYNGDAVKGVNFPWTLINYGVLQAAVGPVSYGVNLFDGGKVVNAANGSVVGSISGGYSGVGIGGGPGTLVNQGTISANNSVSRGAYLGAGGTVTNGASGATTALISGGNDGIVFAGAP